MTKLTSINLSTGVTPNDFIHIVNTGDTSQSIDGSSYKATLGQLSSLYTFTGGTVAGITNFPSGVNTSTISATTYINLPTDIYVTGGTYSTGTTTFKNNTGGTFNVTGYTLPFTGGSSNCITDLYVTNIHGCSPITIHDNIKSNGSTVSGTTSFAFGNSVGSYANYSAILGGSGNNVSSGGTSAGIFAGSGNTITGNSESSVIVGGSDNTISGHTNAFIGGGQNNLIDFSCASQFTGYTNESIIGGDNNKIYSSYNSSIVGGSGNTVTNVTFGGGFNNLFGGTNNILRNGVSSSIIGGQSNLIGVSNCSTIGSTIIGGSGNTLNQSQNNDYATIIGGIGNDSNSDYTSIIGNYKSNIGTSSEYSSLIGGYTNGITASTSSIIGGGELNRIDGGTYNAILGGYNNNIKYNVNNSVIIGGYENVIDNGVNYSVILGGIGITATTSDYVYVPSLNIKTLGSGTSVNNLGIDSNGNIVTGTTGGGGGISITPYNNVGSTTIINWDVSGVSSNYEVTLTGVSTLNLSNVRNGEYGTIIVKQDVVGSRTLSFGTVNGAAATHRVINGGAGVPTLTSNASAIDILSFTYNGTFMFWTVGNDYN